MAMPFSVVGRCGFRFRLLFLCHQSEHIRLQLGGGVWSRRPHRRCHWGHRCHRRLGRRHHRLGDVATSGSSSGGGMWPELQTQRLLTVEDPPHDARVLVR